MRHRAHASTRGNETCQEMFVVIRKFIGTLGIVVIASALLAGAVLVTVSACERPYSGIGSARISTRG